MSEAADGIGVAPSVYYQDSLLTIYHGDAFNVLPTLPDCIAHLVISDPPYFRVVDDDWDDQWGPDPAEFLRWIGTFVDEGNRLLADRGTFGVFCSPDMASGVETEVRRRMAVLNHIVWRKPGPGRLGPMEKETMRRFWPMSERVILAEKSRNPDGDLYRFRDHVNHAVARDVYAEIRERLVTLRDAAGLTNRDIDRALDNGMAGHYFGGSQWTLPNEAAWLVIVELLRGRGVDPPTYADLRREFDSRRQEFDSRRQEFDSRRQEFDSRPHRLELLTDVWTFDPVPASQRLGGHPTQKPLALIAHLVRTLSRTGDTILDPFMGSGTTLVAAKYLNRRAIGIEIEERYCEIAANRCRQEALGLVV